MNKETDSVPTACAATVLTQEDAKAILGALVTWSARVDEARIVAALRAIASGQVVCRVAGDISDEVEGPHHCIRPLCGESWAIPDGSQPAEQGEPVAWTNGVSLKWMPGYPKVTYDPPVALFIHAALSPHTEEPKE